MKNIIHRQIIDNIQLDPKSLIGKLIELFLSVVANNAVIKQYPKIIIIHIDEQILDVRNDGLTGLKPTSHALNFDISDVSCDNSDIDLLLFNCFIRMLS
jgi:hypothetical protein